MNILTAFVSYLEDSDIATLGQDLFVGGAPSSDHAPDAIYWLKANGGQPDPAYPTGSRMKSYGIQIYYRDRNNEAVYTKIFALEELLNTPGVALDGFEAIELSTTTFPTDNDLDDEDRKVGLLQATIKIYKEQP
jgi:Bacteriophage minor capsid protein